ncbi:MAG: O-antigen ligase family protein [Xenococcaceae cyanobacterium]
MLKNSLLLPRKIFSFKNFSLGTPFWAFFILNLPSIKLLYSSEIVNILAIIGLGFTYFLNSSKILIGEKRIQCFAIFSLFWMILLIYGIFGSDAVVSNLIFLRYISVYFTVVGLIFFISEKDLPKIIVWQIIWGTILSIYQINYGFNFDKFEGIHYQTVAIPMTTSLLIILGLIFFTKNIVRKKNDKFILWTCLLLNILSITTLEGRSPLLFSLLVLVIFLLYKVNWGFFLKGRNSLKILRVVLITFILIYIGFINLQAKLSNWGLERYYRLFYNIQQEPRIGLYQGAIRAIIENPLGYGLNAAEKLIGFYPHNIFLEILISAGIIGLIPFLILVALYIHKMKNTVKKSSYHVPFAMMSLYLFFTWNVSFDLASSYMSIGSMVIVICTSNNYKNIIPISNYSNN